MKLTSEIIQSARVSVNPLRERELDLRGYKLIAVENLGITRDGFDCIDFSDNDIKKLENFPRMKRLRMIIMHNNQLSKIQTNLNESIPSVETLELSGNKITDMNQIQHLECLPKLDCLALVGNPVCKEKNYRYNVIMILPQLLVLDYMRIKLAERQAAKRWWENKDLPDDQPDMQVDMPKSPLKSKNNLPVENSRRNTEMEVEKEESSEEDVESAMDVDEEEKKHSPPVTPVKRMKVVELRSELTKRGLPTDGLKAVLIKRLEEAL